MKGFALRLVLKQRHKELGNGLLVHVVSTLRNQSVRIFGNVCWYGINVTAQWPDWLTAPTSVFGVEPAVQHSFAWKGKQMRGKGQYKAELTLSPRLHVKPLMTSIRANTYIHT